MDYLQWKHDDVTDTYVGMTNDPLHPSVVYKQYEIKKKRPNASWVLTSFHGGTHCEGRHEDACKLMEIAQRHHHTKPF